MAQHKGVTLEYFGRCSGVICNLRVLVQGKSTKSVLVTHRLVLFKWNKIVWFKNDSKTINFK